MFGWAEQRSSQAFRTKCVQTHVRRLEKQSVSFFVKQFILRLFLWNVNQPMLNVFFALPRMQKWIHHDSQLSPLFYKTAHSTKQSFTTDAIFCVTSAMTCHDKVQAKRFQSELSVQVCSRLLTPKEICFKVHFHHMCLKAEWGFMVTFQRDRITIWCAPNPCHWNFM